MALRLTNAGTVILLAAVLLLQWHAANLLLGSSLGGDQAKHFTSGVMVFDYLHTSLGSSPTRFAEDFEVRYPLVSIGHWPPLYYVIQAVFYFLAGPTICSAQVLSALTAAGLALLVFTSLRSHVGLRIALIAAACLLAMPLMQVAAWQVMSDLLTGIFVFLAIVAFARLLDDTGNWKAAIGFVIFAVAAIFTKGSAWALGPFVLLAPLLCRRGRFLRSRWFLGALLAVMVAGSSFYLIAQRAGIGYPARLSYYATVGIGHRFSALAQVLDFAPSLLIVLSILGTADAVYARWRRADDSSWTTLSLVAAAWVMSQIVFLFVLPMTFEPRVLLPSLAPAAILTARLLWRLQDRFEKGWQRARGLAQATPLALAALVVASAGAIPAQRTEGYREAADAMPYPADGALILVATNFSGGEEQIIAERLSQGRDHRDVILRGSHVLTKIDAAGNDQPQFQNVEALRNYLLQMPVRFVVLSGPPFDFSYQAQIESAVTGDPKDFQLIAQVPIVEQLNGQVGRLRIYENPAGRDRHPSIVQTPMGYDAGRRMLEYRWK